MIRSQDYSFRLLITPSLLNSWLYIWNCVDNVHETEKDTICLEDKKMDAQVKAKEDFINTLKRLPSEPNKYMQMGIDFEDECCQGRQPEISPIIEGGSYQIVGKKNVTIGGYNFLLYGRLDVLKGGVIYDIKRVMKYTPQKYLKSCQHGFYFKLFDRAYEFTYLIYDGNKLHTETYYRDEVESIDKLILDFIDWLKENNLFELYKEKWVCHY